MQTYITILVHQILYLLWCTYFNVCIEMLLCTSMYVRMYVHKYINMYFRCCMHAVGVVDYSGFELRYLDQQRKFDSGILMLGHRVTHEMIIPPGLSNFSTFGECSANCTTPVSVCVACTTPVSVYMCCVQYSSECMCCVYYSSLCMCCVYYSSVCMCYVYHYSVCVLCVLLHAVSVCVVFCTHVLDTWTHGHVHAHTRTHTHTHTHTQ